ncbi:MAG: competence type IV pilus major pilin ComGC [Erysipelotrichaceae bacterium]|nr:competence type IV pilus major pilin ComGC [Erysipelotrichaceae bacterium]
MNRNLGFTLLEMIVVVAIMAILFLLSIPNVGKVMKSIEDKGCESLTKVVDTAIIEYKLDNDEFPTSIDQLVASGYLTDKQTKCSNGNGIYIDADGHAVSQ